MAIPAGTQFGPYQIVALIGSGGMGEVYRARDTKLKRDVAVKSLPAEFSNDYDRLSRFQREAEVLASLNHPNIAAIYDLQEAGGARFLVLELVEGETLADRIQRGPIRIDEALPIAKSICDALEAAHQQGIVHRDLKPANIKVTPAAKVKVLDFGLAKVQEGVGPAGGLSNSPTLVSDSIPGAIMGTAAYMSPEQAKGKEADRISDVWAFGCVLYEMLTGRAAFEGATTAEILAGVLRAEPDWQRIPRETPQGIRRLLRRCLQKDLKERLHDIADARIEIDDVKGSSETVQPLPSSGSRSRERTLWISALAVVLIGAAGLALPAFRHFREEAPREMRLDINTPQSSVPLEFALSPDGTHLAFVANDNGTQRIWVKPLNGAAARPLAGTEGAGFLFWSPDSQSIAFFLTNSLRRIEVDGSSVQTLVQAGSLASGSGSWGRDGTIAFSSGLNRSGLFRISSTGGTPQALTHTEEGLGMGHSFPQFLPDGRHFLFYEAAGGTQLPSTGIYLGSLDSAEVKRLVASDAAGAWVPPGWLLYLQQGTLRAQALDVASGTLTGSAVTVAERVGYGNYHGGFSTSATGMIAYRTGPVPRTQLMWFERTGKTAGTVGEADEAIGAPELSPDGRRLAVDRTVQGNADVWLFDLLRGGATRFTFSTAVDSRPVWSADGAQIVFRANGKGPFDLYTKPSAGAGAEQLLLQSPYTKTPDGWSADGRFLLYNENNGKTSDILALPMQGDRKPIPIANSPFLETNGQFSPDGRWVAYQSDESGRSEIYVVPFPPGGGKWQISTDGGIQPRWRHDGKELFFIAPDSRMMAAAISPSGSSFEAAPPVALFQTGIAEVVTGIKQQYDVSADGRFLINTRASDGGASPITLILNWHPKP